LRLLLKYGTIYYSLYQNVCNKKFHIEKRWKENSMEIPMKKISGFSGCGVYIANCNDFEYILKVSKNKSYNNRLNHQIEKQKEFKNIISSVSSEITSPEVYCSYVDDNGLFSCEMEYINPMIFDNCDFIFNKLLVFIKIALTLKPFEENNEPFHKAISSKIKQLLPYLTDELKYTLIETEKEITKLDLSPTFCHGDFTLENMILSSDGKLYLIDFLDSFFSHIWLDFSKLYQEIEADWISIKNKTNHVKQNSGHKIFKQKFDAYLIENFPEYIKYHYWFLALTLLRIIPYTNDKEILKALSEKSLCYLKYFMDCKKLGDI